MNDVLSFLKSLFPVTHHHRVVLVGGTVRDMLAGGESRDLDLVTDLSPAELSLLGFRPVSASSGVDVHFKHHPVFTKIEVTRIDSMDNLAEDIQRRDFTINAMALDLSGVLTDPLGGKDDLAARLLRVCSIHSFAADPLRLFRAFRFETEGWRMAPETAALIGSGQWGAAFRSMPIERFSGEMLKALGGKYPEIFFQRMVDLNAGAEFLPELFRMPQIPAGPVQHHPEGDLLSHSVQVLQRIAAESDDPLARFCAFFHDLGKLVTDPALYPKHHGHDAAGLRPAVDLCTRLHLSAEHRRALAWVNSLHGKANIWETLRHSTKLSMAEQACKGGIVRILPLIAAADKPGNLPMAGWDETVRVAGMNTRELGIDLEKLEALPVRKRPSYIMQKRIEVLKECLVSLPQQN